MEKEAGEIDRAVSAYEEAARLRPEEAEPLLQMGHMAKAWRQPAEAAGYFVGALKRDCRNLEAVSELARLMPDRNEIDPGSWSAVLAVLKVDPATLQSEDADQLPPSAMVFDVTDLLAFFGRRRLPTGIQRVQIEVSLACLEGRFDPQPTFCIYASARRGWVSLSHDAFYTLCRLAKQSDEIEDPAWIGQLDQIYRKIAIARTIQFSPATVMINLGTSWSDRNYLLDVRNLRARNGVVYVPLVFDLIPLIEPRWFMQSLVRDYRAWFGSLLHSADGCLAISKATRDDLLEKSVEWNAPMPRRAVPVVRLDGDFQQIAADPGSLQALGLKAQRYVLFVSTLEPRKNHRGAFEAWLALADTLGEAAMPRLVCVGGRGWLNEHLHRMLQDRPVLQRLVLILHGIPDNTLAALYQNCLFALYPSFYEGWGLPVSEALSYGKVPAISRVSSLPEAGGAYAYYFDPNKVTDIAATVSTLFDDGARQTAEAAIREGYAPRTWHQIAQDLVTQASMITSRMHETLPCITSGVWTLAVPHQTEGIEHAQMVGQGEAFRHGRSWQSPGTAGCRIDGDDAELWFRWAGARRAILHIHFATMPESATIEVGIDGRLRKYRAEPGIPLIVSAPLPHAATTLRIPIVPLAGEVVVEKIVLMPMVSA